MSASHDSASDPVWAAFAQAEKAAEANLELRYQDIERWNAYLIHHVLGLPPEKCPYIPSLDINLSQNIRNLPPYSEATLFLQPNRIQELVNDGANELEAAFKGSPFMIAGDNFSGRTEKLIDDLLSRAGAVHDIRINNPGTEIWTGTIGGKVIDFVFQNYTILTPAPEDENASTNIFTLYARKEHNTPGTTKQMPDLSEYGNLPPRYRRVQDKWQ